MHSARRVGLVLLALAALAILSVRSQVRGGEEDNRTLDSARHLRELDAQLDRAVLESNSGLTLDYDTITGTLHEMNALQRELDAEAATGMDPALLEHVPSTRQLILEKARFVESFESSRSVLRNSVAYLTRAAETLAADASPEVAPGLRAEVSLLLAGVVQCMGDCDANALAGIEASMTALAASRDGDGPEGRKDVEVLLKHAHVFVTAAPEVARSIRGLLQSADAPYDDLYLAIRDRRDGAIERANVYRYVLLALSFALVVAIGVMVLRLDRNANALRGALERVAREKRIVDEKQREVSALNENLESRVAERTAELSASREEYRALLETTDAIPWAMAPGSLRFTYVGPQAVRLLGHPLADWTNNDFLKASLDTEDVVETLRALETLSADGARGEIEFRMLAEGGREIWLRGFVRTAHDAESRPVRRGIFLDVTARRMLEAELRSSQKLESLGRVAAGVAHEINTPVQFVADSVHFVKSVFTDLAPLIATFREAVRAELTAEERPLLALAAREADVAADTDYALVNVPQAIESSIEGLGRIATIVKSLKDFSHPDRTRKTAVDLNANIRSTLKVAANEYRDIADVQTDLGDLPSCVCHGGEINQVVLNLVVNATHAIADAMKTTRRRGVITVRTWQEGSMACICVRDTGGGIPANIRDKIFDPFFTTKDVGRGTGQGLAIARKIVVETHGGELTFETELGRGTAFVMRLPVDGVVRKQAAAA